MLSLNITQSSSTAPQKAPENRAKQRGSTETDRHADFQSYLMAMVPQKQSEPVNPAPMPAIETQKSNVADGNPVQGQPYSPSEKTAQKAGDGNNQEAIASNTADKREKTETGDKSPESETKPIAAKSTRELLQALGLQTKNAGVATAAAAKAHKPNTTEPKAAFQLQTVATHERSKLSVASNTLTKLQSAPDVVLTKTDGLQKLGEKLGLSFLERVSEKITQAQNKDKHDHSRDRTEVKTEAKPLVVNTTQQKTGDGMGHQQNSSTAREKEQKHAQVRNVSRETNQASLKEKQVDAPTLTPAPSIAEIVTPKHNPPVHEVRLSESVSTVRAQDSVRSAVENPTMRADMARQFSDIMARAQVLVTDSQNAQFSVKLYPRDLGRMQIDLKLIDGEIRGKIVVESEDVKNEMQNFLQNRDQQGSEQQLDLNRIDIEVRNGNQYAQNSQETADPDELLQNLVTRVATDAYEQTTSATSTAKGLYA
jgi:hypothetical protein